MQHIWRIDVEWSKGTGESTPEREEGNRTVTKSSPL